jgi:hypothetical protein
MAGTSLQVLRTIGVRHSFLNIYTAAVYFPCRLIFMNDEHHVDGAGIANDSAPTVTGGKFAALSSISAIAARLPRRLIAIGASLIIIAVLGTLSWLSHVAEEASVGENHASEAVEPKIISFGVSVAQAVAEGDDTLRLEEFDATVDQVNTIASIERLRVLKIDGGKMTPEAGMVFSQLPHLEQLHIRGAVVDDATLRAIGKSPHLWLINVSSAKVKPATIAGLAAMPKLRQLRLGVANGTNEFANAIAMIRQLRTVHLIGIAINNDGLQTIASLPNLESLYLDDTIITDSGWLWLFENRTHLHVHINQRHHDRDPQKH